MKCQNCGINFDDDERRCPICDYPAGKRGRIGVPRYTSGSHTVHRPDACTHKTYTKQTDYTGAAKKPAAVMAARAAAKTAARRTPVPQAKKKQNAFGLLIAVIAILFGLLPAAGEMIKSSVSDLTTMITGEAPTPEATWDEAYEQVPEEDEDWYEVRSVLGEETIAYTGDSGLLRLTIDEYDNVTLWREGDGWTAEMIGYAMSYLLPDEERPADAQYPAESFDAYQIGISFDEGTYTGDGYEKLGQVGEDSYLWCIAYCNRSTDAVTLVDQEQTCDGLFGGVTALPLHPISEG